MREFIQLYLIISFISLGPIMFFAIVEFGRKKSKTTLVFLSIIMSLLPIMNILICIGSLSNIFKMALAKR